MLARLNMNITDLPICSGKENKCDMYERELKMVEDPLTFMKKIKLRVRPLEPYILLLSIVDKWTRIELFFMRLSRLAAQAAL